MGIIADYDVVYGVASLFLSILLPIPKMLNSVLMSA